MKYWYAPLATALILLALGAGQAAAANDLVPPRIVHQPVTSATAGDLLYYESKHDLNLGDKGEEAFNLSTRPPACGQEALVFHTAKLVYKRKRFGEASIARSPPSGCFICSPLVVSWYHEPTGYVDFQIHIYRKRVTGNCRVP